MYKILILSLMFVSFGCYKPPERKTELNMYRAISKDSVTYIVQAPKNIPYKSGDIVWVYLKTLIICSKCSPEDTKNVYPYILVKLE